MWAACLFCHSHLGRNSVLPTFQVGARLAFDPARGRLWVLCPRCGRWNLSPLEERWEAIEDAERHFRGSLVRVSTDNIGLAEIDDGLTLYEPVGCEHCNEGYKGRVGIYQVMPMLEDIQKIILQGGNALQIAEVARQAGINDLRASALSKVKHGVTSLAEIDRVTKD